MNALFNVDRFPNIMDKIFNQLDAVSLLRSRLVSRSWNQIVKMVVLDKGRNRRLLSERWRSGTCSMRPLISNLAVEMAEDHKYRNVLGLKADAIEILVALDNGNIEIYDRKSLRMTHTILGKKNVSPGLLEISPSIIMVEYTVSFGPNIGIGRSKARRSSGPSWDKKWWKIFSRSTKELLR